jgi:hypothetical protein
MIMEKEYRTLESLFRNSVELEVELELSTKMAMQRTTKEFAVRYMEGRQLVTLYQ